MDRREDKQQYYLSNYEDIMVDFDYDKNDTINPSQITKGSNKKIHWKCHVCGHEWLATPYTRIIEKHGCRMCAVKKSSIPKKPNIDESIGKLYPESIIYWDNTLNEFTPYDITPMSSTTIHWQCPKGHSWTAKASKFSMGQRCPYCKGRKVLTGYNDLQTCNPQLMLEWDYEKNIDIDPQNIYYLSTRYAWWKCSNNHSWRAKICVRNTTGCPFCSNKKVSTENNLAANFPNLVNEWYYEKNAPLLPEHVLLHSGKKVWWKCQYGHEWQATIHKRTSSHQGCPQCAMKYSTSFPEQALYYYLSQLFHVKNRAIIENCEADLVIEELNLIVEYNGVRYHSTPQKIEYDKNKETIFLNAGYNVLIIEESPQMCATELLSNKIKYFPKYDYKNLSEVIFLFCEHLKQFYHLDVQIDFNLSRDRSKIVKQFTYNLIENSFGNQHPQKIKYWNKSQNGALTPYMFSSGSRMVIAWTCDKCNYTWNVAIKYFSKAKHCPNCRNQLE